MLRMLKQFQCSERPVWHACLHTKGCAGTRRNPSLAAPPSPKAPTSCQHTQHHRTWLILWLLIASCTTTPRSRLCLTQTSPTPCAQAIPWPPPSTPPHTPSPHLPPTPHPPPHRTWLILWLLIASCTTRSNHDVRASTKFSTPADQQTCHLHVRKCGDGLEQKLQLSN